MATKPVSIGQKKKAHLYIKEWFDEKRVSDETVANRIGVARETVWKWRTQQHRLNPDKIATLASAIEIEPEDFFRPPTRPSIDARTKGLPDEFHEDVLDFAERLLKRRA